jgi:hypothetical protein
LRSLRSRGAPTTSFSCARSLALTPLALFSLAQHAAEVAAGARVNADGTIKNKDSDLTEKRNLARIDQIARFLLRDNESVAGPIVMTSIALLTYPDAHTCRRAIKICHRILEVCATNAKYENIFAQMYETVIKNVLLEPMWISGCEWDLIALARDIYVRMCLGQFLMPGGQGPGCQCQMQHDNTFQQPKSADDPRAGGGVFGRPSTCAATIVTPSPPPLLTLLSPGNLPRAFLASLPGKDAAQVQAFETQLNAKRSAKEQKNCFRDFLLSSSKLIKQGGGGAGDGVFARNEKDQSVLDRSVKSDIEQIPGAGTGSVGNSKKKKKKMKAVWDQEQALDGSAANLFS